MISIIVAGGTPPKDQLFLQEVRRADYLIAADKGAEIFIKHNIEPDLVVGDFDSIDDKFKENLKKLNVIKFNPEKDLTDSEIAFNKAIEIGSTEIVLLGFTGTRLDHTLANLGLLKRALEKGIKAFVKDNNNCIFLTDKSMKLEGKFGQIISFQAYCDVVNNFNIKKAKYKLVDYTLLLGDPRTVSNEFLQDNIEITFTDGIVMVIYSAD